MTRCLKSFFKFGIIVSMVLTGVIVWIQFSYAYSEPNIDLDAAPIVDDEHDEVAANDNIALTPMSNLASEDDILPEKVILANVNNIKMPQLEEEFINGDKEKTKVDSNLTANLNIHTFYYAWYGNPVQDGEYIHWNHEYLPHWNAKISSQYPTGQKHKPPDDIGVLALSWYPPGQADDNGKAVESYVPVIFNIANEFGIKVCFHIEPYKNRNPESVRADIQYIIDTYGNHPAFYRYYSSRTSQKLPLIYMYDSYLIDPSKWKRLLGPTGDLSIRSTKYDCVVIGLLVEQKHLHDITAAGFDGMYTYFAADGFTYGSTTSKWKDIALYASRNSLIFIPSVGPGYDDTRVRPWNKANSRDRRDGAYYESGWAAAKSSPGVDLVSITSFNEWHEGTQIEPAAPETTQGSFLYLTYGSNGPDFYIRLTRKWSDIWSQKRQNNS